MDNWSLGLVICALLLGWLIGRVGSSRTESDSAKEVQNYNESYIRGLNYLLANQSDKAIDLFVELVKVDQDTMETHLALGNLFRNKGEVDRAIKIHQNLIARPNLTQGQRVMALSELAEDYQKAGLLDRAENLNRELVQINPRNEQVQRKLFEIYSLEKSWQEARQAAEVLVELNVPDARLILTHCYCELAEQAFESGNIREARQQLSHAIDIESNCERAKLLLLKVYLHSQELSRAGKLFEQLQQTEIQHIELLIPPARELYRQRGSNQNYLEFLRRQYDKTPASALAVELLSNYLATEQHDLLLEFLLGVLKNRPVSLDVFGFAMRYFKNYPANLDLAWPELSEKFIEFKSRQVAHVCQACGFGSHRFFWKCPSCQSWSSMKLVN
jgi:lipopolysaccharide biosynthesis regulator YciM